MASKSPGDLMHVCFTVDNTFPVTLDVPHLKEEIGLHFCGTHKSCVSTKHHQWRRSICTEEVTAQETNTPCWRKTPAGPLHSQCSCETQTHSFYTYRGRKKKQPVSLLLSSILIPKVLRCLSTAERKKKNTERENHLSLQLAAGHPWLESWSFAGSQCMMLCEEHSSHCQARQQLGCNIRPSLQ